jgi:hypothetical protein
MVREWQNNFTKDSILILRKELNKIKYNKGYAISKTDIEHTFNRIKKQVPQKLLIDVSNYVEHAYFFAGGIGNNSIVGYSPYFQKTYLGDFLRNDRYGTNSFYDPNFFCTILETLDIISSPIEIKNMSLEQIEYIRNHRVFKDFTNNYKIFSRLCQNLVDYPKITSKVIKKFTDEMSSIRKDLSGVSKYLGILLSGSPILIPIPPYNLIISLISLLYSFLSDTVVSTKFCRSIGLERMIINMEAKNHPFGSFCLILKNVIQEKTY